MNKVEPVKHNLIQYISKHWIAFLQYAGYTITTNSALMALRKHVQFEIALALISNYFVRLTL